MSFRCCSLRRCEEYERVLRRPAFQERYGLTVDDVSAFLVLLDTHGLLVEADLPIPVDVRDAKDEMVLATALAGEANCLVTGDDDLLILRDNPQLASLQIMTAREFLTILQAADT